MTTYELPKREIKFRVIYEGEKTISECRGVCRDTKKALCFLSGCRERRKYRHIMQYTGLKDRNGVEIYEGDILSFQPEETFILIRWDISGGNWQFDEINLSFDDGHGRGKWDFNMGVAKKSEVIGNIFEHPHLLEA